MRASYNSKAITNHGRLTALIIPLRKAHRLRYPQSYQGLVAVAAVRPIRAIGLVITEVGSVHRYGDEQSS